MHESGRGSIWEEEGAQLEWEGTKKVMGSVNVIKVHNIHV
jgi:hypothetical protein